MCDQIAMRMRRTPPTSERELMIRATALAGRTVAEIAMGMGWPLPDDARRAKGYVGMLIEAALGASPEANELPDFLELGIELKTIPLTPQGKPVESTFCCSIDMDAVDRELWETSRLRRRLARVLWMPVTAARFAALPDRRIGKPVIWSPSAKEDTVLRHDWEHIAGVLGAGGDITAHAGEALQARPKAATAKVRALGIAEDGLTRRLPLGFYLRTSFTAGIVA